jgi:hypothetical protein
MLHACFYTICLVFCYTSWHFYAISGTNLLTRCHSASSLFSAIFVFQKSYTWNILGIGWNKFQKSNFSWKSIEDRTRAGGGPGDAHTTGGRGPSPGCAHPLWGHPGCLLTPPLRLYKVSRWKTLGESVKFPEEFRSSAAADDEFWGTEVSVPAPCWDREVPPEPSPLVSIAISAVSIDFTAISTNLAVSYNEEGVVLPRGWGLYR